MRVRREIGINPFPAPSIFFVLLIFLALLEQPAAAQEESQALNNKGVELYKASNYAPAEEALRSALAQCTDSKLKQAILNNLILVLERESKSTDELKSQLEKPEPTEMKFKDEGPVVKLQLTPGLRPMRVNPEYHPVRGRVQPYLHGIQGNDDLRVCDLRTESGVLTGQIFNSAPIKYREVGIYVNLFDGTTKICRECVYLPLLKPHETNKFHKELIGRDRLSATSASLIRVQGTPDYR